MDSGTGLNKFAHRQAAGVRHNYKTMASAFWILEDGRGLAIRWSGMAYMLELVTHELKEIKGAEIFYEYMEKLVYREENGDEYNG